MNTYKRSGNRWTVSELLSLQREYELLEWTVGQIAEKHQRSMEAILFRLESEGFISSWNEARGFDTQQYQSSCTENIQQKMNENDLCCDDNMSVDEEQCDDDDSEYFGEEVVEEDDDMSVDDDMSEVDKLTERVWNLETSVSEISSMVKQMFDTMVSKKSPKRQPLRKY